jgi:hypothetical protein
MPCGGSKLVKGKKQLSNRKWLIKKQLFIAKMKTGITVICPFTINIFKI